MSGSLSHSPADIVRRLLIDLSQGTDPSDGGSWPIFTGAESDTPDNAITIYDAASILGGRTQIDGEVQEHYGFRVRVRAVSHAVGDAKARAIAIVLDETVYQDTVTIGAIQYLVQAVSRKSGVLRLGKEVPGSRRHLFTINAVVALRQTT